MTTTKSNRKVVLAVHGGAGVILRSQLTPEMESQYRSALAHAMSVGYNILRNDSNTPSISVATDAAEAAVRCLEDCPLFNAGMGSVICQDGKIRMDAAIMNCSSGIVLNGAGRSNNQDDEDTTQNRNNRSTPKPTAGAVAGVEGIKNPISLARAVMDRTPHVMLIGKGAEEFASTLPKNVIETRPRGYFWTESRFRQLEKVQNEEAQDQLDTKAIPSMQMQVQLDHAPNRGEHKFGTVGCVVAFPIDHGANPQVLLASATSTGGMTNQRYNRVGDSPIIGAGTYANHLCAISCTGHGEHFIRCVAAHDIAARLEYRHGYGSVGNEEVDKTEKSDRSALRIAAQEVILGTLMGDGEEDGGQGGVIAIDRDGNFVAEMNCPGMYHGWVYEDGEMETRIFREECMQNT